MSEQFQLVAAWIELAANITVILGVPWALLHYIKNQRQQARDQDQRRFDTLADEYQEWIDFCLANRDLPVSDWEPAEQTHSVAADRKRLALAFTKLVCLFEHAFIMYNPQISEFRRRQWDGWRNYIAAYAGRRDFKNYWADGGGDQFDVEFVKFMSQEIGLPTSRKYSGFLDVNEQSTAIKAGA